MQTIKTAVVVVLLLFVLYGGYVALNGTDTPLNPDLQNLVDMDAVPDVSGASGPFLTAKSGSSASGFESFGNTPAPTFGSSNGPSNSPFSSTNTNSPSNSFDSAIPPLSLPTSNKVEPSLSSPTSAASIPSTLSTPSSATASSGSTSGIALPALPPLPNSESPSSAAPSKSSIPVSTNTPVLDISHSGPTIPADIASEISSLSNSNSPSASSSIPAMTVSTSEKMMESSRDSMSTELETKSPSTKSSFGSKSFENAKSMAMEQIGRSHLKEALATLSTFYNAPDLSNDQRQDLLDMLDALAGEVIYSRRHMLESVYVVAPGETMSDIAKRYNVPIEIIARINGADLSSPLLGGTKLKVVPGPFRAEVDLARNELTVFLGDLYAGRYPISVGQDPAPKPGNFQVTEKQLGKNYYGAGVQISKEDPRNPYGGWWIDIGHDMSIHGSPETPADPKWGCISLSPMDASDIFGMLGRGSPVTIRQ